MPRYYRPPITRGDGLLISTARDFTNGQNNRQRPSILRETEAKTLTNVDLSLPGSTSRRPGLTLVEDLGANAIVRLANYDPQGGSANLIAIEGTNLKRWTGSGSFTSVSTGLTTGLYAGTTQAFKTGVGDILLVSNGTDNVMELDQSYTFTDLGDTNTSPPKTTVYTTFRNRAWALKSDLLYFSSAAPSNWATAFDRTTNVFRIPVGEERALAATRDFGIIIFGKTQIWALNPSITPAATDRPEKISDWGCAAGRTVQQVGDDYFYLAFDGVRGLRRTEQDKLQYGTSLPISYRLKSEFETINWSQIHKACAVTWNNKYILALPTAGSSVPNQLWIYYPATDGWSIVTGWSVGDMAVFKISGEERLYIGNGTADGKVFRGWSGASDNSTAINWVFESRSDDLGKPAVKKVGGELEVSFKPTGNYDITVYGSFDDGEYQELGTVNVSTGLITFPASFPVIFNPENEIRDKFHLDSYGEWFRFRYKLSHNAVTTNADDITFYGSTLTGIESRYYSE